MRLPGPVLVPILILVGILLAYPSGFILPLGYGVTIFWLGILVVANGSIWFGVWGVISAALFPALTSLILLDVDIAHIVAMLPANTLEGLIPAVAFRLLRADPGLQDRRSLVVYGLFAIVIPSAVGGWLTGRLWLLLDISDRETLSMLSVDWALSNMLMLVVFGIPAMVLLTPLLRRRGLLVEGWLR